MQVTIKIKYEIKWTSLLNIHFFSLDQQERHSTDVAHTWLWHPLTSMVQVFNGRIFTYIQWKASNEPVRVETGVPSGNQLRHVRFKLEIGPRTFMLYHGSELFLQINNKTLPSFSRVYNPNKAHKDPFESKLIKFITLNYWGNMNINVMTRESTPSCLQQRHQVLSVGISSALLP